MTQTVRTNYGASLSPDATAFAHLVDDGGYPRAVQRFLRGWRASSSRDVELPVEGPVTRVMHSADGHWLACEVAPEGGTRSQIWVVTTDPDDRAARRIDVWRAGLPEGTAELIGWDGTQVAAILTGDDGVGSSCLIDPADGTTTVLDRRSGGRLVDAWAGAALVRVGPRGYRDLIMLRGLTEIALLPYDPGSTTDSGMILDDQSPRRLRSGLEGEHFELYQPAKFYGVEQHQRLCARADPQRERRRPRPPARGDDDRRRRVLPSGGRAAGLRAGRVRRQRRPVDGGAAVEHQRRQRVTDPRIRRLHAARPDSAARHGGQRAEHQRRRLDGGDDRRRARRSRARSNSSIPRTREWEPVDREPSSGPVVRGSDAGNHHRPRRLGVHRLVVPSTGGRRTRSGR